MRLQLAQADSQRTALSLSNSGCLSAACMFSARSSKARFVLQGLSTEQTRLQQELWESSCHWNRQSVGRTGEASGPHA